MSKEWIMPYNQATLERIIRDGDPKELVTTAESLGEELYRAALTTAQIRNLFGTARRTQANWRNRDRRAGLRRELVLVQPKLEYQATREKPVAYLKEW